MNNRHQCQASAYQENRSNTNNAKDWIENSIREGFINSYSESNISINLFAFARGAYAAVHKGTMKHSRENVAIKILFPDEGNYEGKFYKKLVKEVVADLCIFSIL